jgi:hypothetical protein
MGLCGAGVGLDIVLYSFLMRNMSFIYCSYATQVWKSIQDKLNPQADWTKSNLEDCFKDWIVDYVVCLYSGLPSIMVSNVWWAWNNNIFNEKLIPLEVVANVTLRMAEDYKAELKSKMPLSSNNVGFRL